MLKWLPPISNIRVVLARVPSEKLPLLEKVGLTQAVGQKHVYMTVRDAVAEWEKLPCAVPQHHPSAAQPSPAQVTSAT